MRFEPNRDLDHSGGDIVKSIVVTSSDGDRRRKLTSTVTLTITDGDVPTIDVIPPVSHCQNPSLPDGSDQPSGVAVSQHRKSISISLTKVMMLNRFRIATE